MKIYKERQFLIFDFENGKTVKYDFAKKETIGIRGKVVKDLRSQLRGVSLDSIFENIEDKNYARFLEYVKISEEDRYNGYITNIGTILDRAAKYERFEQIFSAGLRISTTRGFYSSINDIPKGLLKICRKHSIELTDRFIDYYKNNPDAFNIAYELEYMSLTIKNITTILSADNYIYRYDRPHDYYTYFGKLVNEHGYNAKALLLYLDNLMTYEALYDIKHVIRELYDYARMMSEISEKFEKYPRHFLTTHKIACRNYERLKQQFDEEKFKARIDRTLECKFGDYSFIYPASTDEIKEEAVSQNNCVASYIKDVINGDCHILFLRKSDEPDKSLVTIEVRGNKIVQARRRFNESITIKEQEIVDKWNNKYNLKEKVA